MLSHGFLDVPGTAHPLREDDEVSLAEGDRFAAVWRDRYLAFKDQAGFLFVVVPGKGGRSFSPGRPRAAAELGDRFIGRVFRDFNWHGKWWLVGSGKWGVGS